MRALALLLLLAMALPLASAQVPPTPTGCGPLTIPGDPVPPSQPLAPGERVQVVVSVQLGGQLPATVTVAAATTSTGWRVVEPPPPAQVQAGSTADFRFTVEAGADAAGPADVQFSASGACETPLGGNCPGNACAAGSANTQVVLPLQEEQGLRIPGLENLSFPVEYLIAAVVLVGLATAVPFALRKKKGGIAADCPEPLKIVRPGLGTNFPIELRNRGREKATAQLEVSPVPAGWSAFLAVSDVQLAPGEARSLWLLVRAPPESATGDVADIELRCREERDGALATVRVRAEVQRGEA